MLVCKKKKKGDVLYHDFTSTCLSLFLSENDPEKSIPQQHPGSEYYTHYSPSTATEVKTGVNAKPPSRTLPPAHTRTPQRRENEGS